MSYTPSSNTRSSKASSPSPQAPVEAPGSNISQIERVVFYYIALFLLLGVLLSIFNQSYFDTVYTVEDGVLEWLTVVALLTSMVVCWQRLLRAGLRRGWPYGIVTLLLTLFFLFGAGEEISWGQRLIGLESNEFFQTYNAQKETNLHNMTVNGKKINQLIFGTGLALVLLIYLAVLTPLYHKRPSVKDWLNRWAVPIPKGYQIVGYILILVTVEVVVKALSDTGRRGELTEFAGAFWVLLNITFPYNEKNFK